MATNMKTITFEDGKVYSVAPRVVAAHEVTTEAGENLIEVDVDELEYVRMVIAAPVGEAVAYPFVLVNGVQSKFASAGIVDTAQGRCTVIEIDCIGEFANGLWYQLVHNQDQPAGHGKLLGFGKFWEGDTITKIGIKAYTNGVFPVGTKVIVKGY